MSRVRLSELEAVLAVVDRKSFRAAARDLGVSPSALSHTIGAVERRLGVRLFHRTTRSVSATPAGVQLASGVRPAMGAIDHALDVLRELRDVPSGTLRVTTSRGTVRHGVIDVIAEMRRRHPAVRIELTTEERLVDLVADGFDAGIRLAEAVPQDMIAVPFGPDLAMAIVGAPSYFAARPPPTTPGDLAAHECIRRKMGNGGVHRWELERRGRVVAVDVQGGFIVDDDAMQLEAVLAGVGLAFIDLQAAAEHLATGRLVRVLEAWTPPFPGLRLFHPSGRLVGAAMRALIEVVREHHGLTAAAGPGPSRRSRSSGRTSRA